MPSFAHDQAEAEKAVATVVATTSKISTTRMQQALRRSMLRMGFWFHRGQWCLARRTSKKRGRQDADAGRTGIRYDIKQVQAEGNIVLVVGQFTVKVPKGGSLQDRSGSFVNAYQWDGGALRFRVHWFVLCLSNNKACCTNSSSRERGTVRGRPSNKRSSPRRVQ